MATIVTRETGATAVNRTLTNAELDNNFINLNTDLGNKQPLDADLTAIAALTGTSGLLKKVGADSWLLDQSTYATQTYVGIQIANLVSSAPAALDTLYELSAALGNDANFATTVSTALGNKQPLDDDLTAIAALSGTNGFLKKTGDGTWSIDTSSYLATTGGTLTGLLTLGSSDGQSLEIRNDSQVSASSGYITFKNKNGTGVYRPAARISGVNVDNAYDGDFLIETYSGGTAYKGLRVDENSYVFFYDTNGTSRFTWDASNSNVGIDASSDTILTLNKRGGSSWGYIGFGYNGTRKSYIGINASGNPEWGTDSGPFNIVGNYTTIASSVRTPIFYDSNDTNYYVDPNSLSYIQRLSVAGYNDSSPSTTYGIQMGGGAAGIEVWNFNPGGSSAYRNLTFYGTGWNGSAVVTRDILTIGNYGGYVGIRNTSPNYELDITGTGYASSDLRAPIFYDSNDTGYYVNPNSTSVIRKTNLVASGAGWEDGLNLYSSDGANRWNLLVDSGASNYLRIAYNNTEAVQITNGRNFISFVDVRSPIYYDYNDTGYYLDPNSTSNTALRIRGGALHGPNPTWGKYLYIGTDGNPGTGSSSIAVTNGNLHLDAENGYVMYLNNYSSSSYTVASQSMRSPIFYDNDDTGYYVDANNGSRLAHLYVGNVGSSNDGSWNARLNVVGSSHARLDVVSNSDGIITTMYSHTGQGIGRIGTYSNHPLGLMAQGGSLGGYVYNGSIRAPLFYDSDDTNYYLDPGSMSRLNRIDPNEIYNHGWFRNHNNLYGLYNQANGVHFYSNGVASWAITGSGGNVELQFRSNHESTMRGYVYANTGGSIGFLDYNGNWRIRGDGANVELYGGTYIDTGYAYIIYDRHDSGYYVDPNSTSRLNTVAIIGNTYLQNSSPTLYFQDNDNRSAMIHVNSNYWYVLRGSGTNSQSWEQYDGYWPLQIYLENNTAQFGGQITKRGVNIPALHVQDAAPSAYNYGDLWWESDTGKLKLYYYDGNTAQWVDAVPIPDTSTFFSKAGGGITGPVVIANSLAVTGALNAEGPLTMITAAASTGSVNRALVIKEAGDATIDMGSYPGSWTSALQIQSNDASTYLWLSPLTSNIPRLQTNYGSFDISSNSGSNIAARFINNSTRASIFYDLDDTAYYLEGNGTSYLYGLTLSGSTYFRPQNWIQIDGGSGLYWPNNHGAHFHPNDASTYTQFRLQGSKNSYGGIYDSYSGVNGFMYDSGGNGGVYREGTGRWYLYHNVGDNCMGVGTSTTSSTYGIYVVKGGYFNGRVDATIYYKAGDTGYYLDPNGTSNLSTTITGYAYFRSNRNTTSDSPPLQAYSNDGGGAIMSFHRGGQYAINFGLDSDNVIRFGGWSASANRLQMDMSGNLTMAGNVTAYSDERLKKDWALLPDDYVERLAEIKSGTYTRIDSGERQVGVSAQDFQLLLTEAVSEDNSGMLSVSYGNAALASSVELAKRIIKQQAEIDELKALVAQLLAK